MNGSYGGGQRTPRHGSSGGSGFSSGPGSRNGSGGDRQGSASDGSRYRTDSSELPSGWRDHPGELEDRRAAVRQRLFARYNPNSPSLEWAWRRSVWRKFRRGLAWLRRKEYLRRNSGGSRASSEGDRVGSGIEGDRYGLSLGGDRSCGLHESFDAGDWAGDYADDEDGIYDEADYGGGSAFGGSRSRFGAVGLNGDGLRSYGPAGYRGFEDENRPPRPVGGARAGGGLGFGATEVSYPYDDYSLDNDPPRAPGGPRSDGRLRFVVEEAPFIYDDYDFDDNLPGTFGSIDLDNGLLDMAVFDDEGMDHVISRSMEQQDDAPSGPAPASAVAIANLP